MKYDPGKHELQSDSGRSLARLSEEVSAESGWRWAGALSDLSPVRELKAEIERLEEYNEVLEGENFSLEEKLVEARDGIDARVREIGKLKDEIERLERRLEVAASEAWVTTVAGDTRDREAE